MSRLGSRSGNLSEEVGNYYSGCKMVKMQKFVGGQLLVGGLVAIHSLVLRCRVIARAIATGWDGTTLGT